MIVNDSDVYQLLQRARDSMLSIDMELLRLSHENDPRTDAFQINLWFMCHHLQGNHTEADMVYMHKRSCPSQVMRWRLAHHTLARMGQLLPPILLPIYI